MRLSLLIGLLSFVVTANFLSGCASSSVPFAALTSAASGPVADYLAQTDWELTRWLKADGKPRPMINHSLQNRPISLRFTYEQQRARVSGLAGCNQFFSTYAVHNGTLLLTTPPSTTYMACDPTIMQLEDDFLKGLMHIKSSILDSEIHPQRLTLFFKTGEILDFARRSK